MHWQIWSRLPGLQIQSETLAYFRMTNKTLRENPFSVVFQRDGEGFLSIVLVWLWIDATKGFPLRSVLTNARELVQYPRKCWVYKMGWENMHLYCNHSAVLTELVRGAALTNSSSYNFPISTAFPVLFTSFPPFPKRPWIAIMRFKTLSNGM